MESLCEPLLQIVLKIREVFCENGKCRLQRATEHIAGTLIRLRRGWALLIGQPLLLVVSVDLMFRKLTLGRALNLSLM